MRKLLRKIREFIFGIKVRGEKIPDPTFKSYDPNR